MTSNQRQKNKVVTIAIIQVAGVLPILIQNLLLRNWLTVQVFSVYSFLCALNYGYFFLRRHYNLWAYVMMVLTAIDFGFYVWHGGVQGAGIFWSLSFPFLAMYLLGHKHGGRFSLVYFSVLLALTGISLLSGFDMHYSLQALVVFFLVSYINIYLLFTLKKSRHEMREEVERINSLFNHVSDMLFIANEKGRFSVVSPSASDVLGWTQEELLSRDYLEFVHPDDRALTHAFNASLVEGLGLKTVDNRYLCKDVSYRWLSWRVTMDKGKKERYAVARDITEEKQTQARLLASEEAFRTLAEQSNAGIFRFQHGRFTHFNRGFVNLLGYPEDEISALDGPHFIHPEDREAAAGWIMRKDSEDTGLAHASFRIVTKQGEEKWVNLVTDLLVTDQGKSVVGTMYDITEAKQREVRLQFRSDLQRLMTDVSTEFINSTPETLEDKINSLLERFTKFLNFDRAILYTLDDNIQQIVQLYRWHQPGIEPFVTIFQEENLDRFEDIRAYFRSFDYLYEPDVFSVESRYDWITEKANRHNNKSVLLLPLVRNKQTMGILGFEAVTHHVTVDLEVIESMKMLTHVLTEVLLKNELDLSLQAAAVALNALNQTKDKLFSIIAHDLRSPFVTMIGFTELMADKTNDLTLEAMQGYAGMLNQVAHVSLELLENLLDWSRLQRGLLKPNRTHIVVEDFIHASIASYQERAVARNQLVNVQVEPGLIANIDKRMMEAVLRNLFTNAIKFTPEGGVISIQALSTEDHGLRLAVSDTGIGIPEMLLPLLFSVDESKNRPGLGGERSSGLGLMLCKEFVELHGGKLWAETVEYKGSTFYVELPMAVVPSRTSLPDTAEMYHSTPLTQQAT